MNNPEITVLMSVYNKESFLHQSIESILNQSFKQFEFLIIDDGSTDNSRQIIQSYQDPRIRLIENKSNIGLTKSLNKGIRLSRGQYIARMDGDDVSLPERLARQYDFLKKNHNYGFVGSRGIIMDEDEKQLHITDDDGRAEYLYYILNLKNVFIHTSVMFKKELIKQLGGYNEEIEYAQDFELWHRISKVNKMKMLEEPLVKWRLAKQGISSLKFNHQQKIVIDIIRQNLSGLTGATLNDTVLRILNGQINLLYQKGFFFLFRFRKIIHQIQEAIYNHAPSFIDKKKLQSILNKEAQFYEKKTRVHFYLAKKCFLYFKKIRAN